jgi:dihydrofolate reductase
MNAIAAVSLNWGLGKDNDLLFHISEDMKRFRSLTGGGTVIMGRKTLDSMPGGKALPKRRNIVITRDPNFTRDGVEVAHSIEEALELVKNEDPDKVWSIGGGQIYAQALEMADRLIVTHVHTVISEADTFFPAIDPSVWQVADRSQMQHDEESGYDFEFVEYKRK